MHRSYLVVSIAGLLLQSTGVFGHQERPKPALVRRDDGTVFNPWPYPYCNPKKDELCITNGKYLVPPLPLQAPDDLGTETYKRFLPTHESRLSKWTNGMMPSSCYSFGVEIDQWDAADFEMYNVTFSDCGKSPFVMCYHVKAQKTPEQIATEISRLPIGMRQSTSTYMVYSDLEADNPRFDGFIGAACPHGLIVGVSEAYFITSLVHEIGHSIDCTLASPDALPGGWGSEFSNTSTWQDAVDKDGVAVSPYGTQSYVENFGEAGRLVLMDNIYPGGVKAFAKDLKNPNITQLTNQLDVIKKSATGKYYNKGGECDLKVKFPFPTDLVDVASKIKEGKKKPEVSSSSGKEGPVSTAAQVASGPAPTNPLTDGAAKPDTKDSGARRLAPFFLSSVSLFTR